MPKVMIVDDDAFVLTSISLGLTRAGYEVIHANSGEAAVRICASDAPDFAMLDIHMPGMSGIELAKVLGGEFRIPFLFLSASNDKNVVSAAVDTGALGYLVKPVEIARIIPAIEVALARSGELKELERNRLDLSHALNSNREIDIAVGLIMERHGLGRAAAFESLRNYARSHRCKVVAVARQMVDGEPLGLMADGGDAMRSQD